MKVSENMRKAASMQVMTNLTQREIAKKLNLTEQTLSNWQKKEEYIDLKADFQREYLGSLSSKAIRTLNDLLTDDNSNVRLGAAKDILDRTGYKPTDKTQIEMSGSLSNPYDELTVEELRKLANLEKD